LGGNTDESDLDDENPETDTVDKGTRKKMKKK
jgi:hypothetical protein